MSSTQLSGDTATEASGPATVAMRFEVTVLPVADDDRAKAFYERLGWRLDADFPIDEHYRVVQFTPTGVARRHPVRERNDDDGARLGGGPLPDRR